jgi:hypothetical protein
MSATWPVSGGGSGDISGPNVSVANSVPVFSDTSGHNLADCQTLGFINLPPGSQGNLPGTNVCSLNFTGTGISNNTGFGGATPDRLIASSAGYEMMRWENGSTATPTITMLATLRPDSGIPTNIGIAGNAFIKIYNRTTLFGGTTSGVGYDLTRRIWTSHAGWSSGGDQISTGIGMGLDANTGSEWFINLWDNTASEYRNAFNVNLDARFSVLSAPDNTDANSTKATTIKVKGANKTAGTGGGGDLVLDGGTSSGGEPGHIYLRATAGAPTSTPVAISGYVAMQFDSSNNKLYAYVGGGWKSVTLT